MKNKEFIDMDSCYSIEPRHHYDSPRATVMFEPLKISVTVNESKNWLENVEIAKKQLAKMALNVYKKREEKKIFNYGGTA